jgi:hypothetical protein
MPMASKSLMYRLPEGVAFRATNAVMLYSVFRRVLASKAFEEALLITPV